MSAGVMAHSVSLSLSVALSILRPHFTSSHRPPFSYHSSCLTCIFSLFPFPPPSLFPDKKKYGGGGKNGRNTFGGAITTTHFLILFLTPSWGNPLLQKKTIFLFHVCISATLVQLHSKLRLDVREREREALLAAISSFHLLLPPSPTRDGKDFLEGGREEEE